jgi:hypothetical protein
MFIPSFKNDKQSLKPPVSSLYNSRSYSSMSNISLKTVSHKPKHPSLTKNAQNLYEDFNLLHKNKKDLEIQVLDALNDIKKLKNVSKTFKINEIEFERLQNNALKFNDEIRNIKDKMEIYNELMSLLHKSLVTSNDIELTKLLPAVNQVLKLNQRKKSIVISDLTYNPDTIKSGIKTSREHKTKSPYFAQSTFHISTPKLKKNTLSALNPKPRFKSDLLLESTDPNLVKIFKRLENILKNLNKC